MMGYKRWITIATTSKRRNFDDRSHKLQSSEYKTIRITKENRLLLPHVSQVTRNSSNLQGNEPITIVKNHDVFAYT